MNVLIAEDDVAMRAGLAEILEGEGYAVTAAADGDAALACWTAARADFVVLDIMMPERSGYDVCREIRRGDPDVPIVFLSAKTDEIDKVLGLELGADDYITKPFSLREFRSRVKAALRRGGMARRDSVTDEEPLEVHELRIDFAKRSVRVRGEEVQTTYVEFEILTALATNPGRVWTRDMLLTRIWGDSAYRDPRTIDVHIRHLREKLELDAKEPEYLFTVRGVGYRFRDTEA